jgi:hypothetical protein
MDNLKHLVRGTRQIELDLFQPEEDLLKQISGLPFVSTIEDQNGNLVVHTLSDRDYRTDLGKFLSAEGAVVQGMKALETTLEDAFITITERHIRQWAAEDQGRDGVYDE